MTHPVYNYVLSDCQKHYGCSRLTTDAYRLLAHASHYSSAIWSCSCWSRTSGNRGTDRGGQRGAPCARKRSFVRNQHAVACNCCHQWTHAPVLQHWYMLWAKAVAINHVHQLVTSCIMMHAHHLLFAASCIALQKINTRLTHLQHLL